MVGSWSSPGYVLSSMTLPVLQVDRQLARHVGIIQSLIVTCRLHGVDPYTYLLDVLQRINEHPASRVAELTPRLWKQHFAAGPMRSEIDDFPPH